MNQSGRSISDGAKVFPSLKFTSEGPKDLDSLFKFTIRTGIDQQPDGGLSVSGYQPLKLDKFYYGTQPGTFTGLRAEKILRESGETTLAVHIDVTNEMTQFSG